MQDKCTLCPVKKKYSFQFQSLSSVPRVHIPVGLYQAEWKEFEL